MPDLGSLTDAVTIIPASRKKNSAQFVEIGSSSCADMRQRLFQEHWDEIQLKIDQLMSIVNDQAADTIINFIPGHTFQYGEIPTAVILGAINAADHDAFYKRLQLKIGVNHPVASISFMQGSSLKPVMKKLIDQLVSDEHDGSHRDYDVQKLIHWAKAKTVTNPDFLIVIMLPDYESFDKSILEQLINILRFPKIT